MKKTRDASNRLLPPIRTTCTRTSCVPDSLRWLPSVDVPRTLRLRTTSSPRRLRRGDRIRGTECFTTPETASADRTCVLTSSSNPSRAGDTSVGVFFPRHSGDRASDTPVATSRLHPQRFIELPRCCLFLCLRPSLAFLRVRRDRRMWKSPSSSSRRLREEPTPVSNWDAFSLRFRPIGGLAGIHHSGLSLKATLPSAIAKRSTSSPYATPWWQ